MDERRAKIERLAALNAAKEKERLESLSTEESARLFEELCRLFHAEFDEPPARKEHPVGLIRIWKQS
jgi:hypothetical protein